MNNHHYAIIINLIGGFNPSEKYESQLGFTIPNWMESHKIHVQKFPNHQPDIYIYICIYTMFIHFLHSEPFKKHQKTSMMNPMKSQSPRGFQPLLSGLCLDLSTTAQGHPARQGVLPKHQWQWPAGIHGRYQRQWLIRNGFLINL